MEWRVFPGEWAYRRAYFPQYRRSWQDTWHSYKANKRRGSILYFRQQQDAEQFINKKKGVRYDRSATARAGG